MRLKWKIKMSAIVIIALAIIFLAYSRADVSNVVSAEEKVVEISYPPKEEEPKLNGWGSKFFDALDGEVDKTKEYQKKQWEKMKKQFKNLFNGDDEAWEEVDKEIKEKEDDTKEEK